mmetsp:Transcript_33177/g.78689  ORF Transcript_33177/g.78689 Transcript_33177/m.78689 type:complete len:290 (-) Transcript_33177:562-1431(-)
MGAAQQPRDGGAPGKSSYLRGTGARTGAARAPRPRTADHGPGSDGRGGASRHAVLRTCSGAPEPSSSAGRVPGLPAGAGPPLEVTRVAAPRVLEEVNAVGDPEESPDPGSDNETQSEEGFLVGSRDGPRLEREGDADNEDVKHKEEAVKELQANRCEHGKVLKQENAKDSHAASCQHELCLMQCMSYSVGCLGFDVAIGGSGRVTLRVSNEGLRNSAGRCICIKALLLGVALKDPRLHLKLHRRDHQKQVEHKQSCCHSVYRRRVQEADGPPTPVRLTFALRHRLFCIS